MSDMDDTRFRSLLLSRRSLVKGLAAGVAGGALWHGSTYPLLAASPSIAYSRGSTSSATVALTFDCGSDLGYTGSILDTAAAYGVPLTFGVTGQFARAHPSYVGRMVAEGHGIMNHSDTHPSFTGVSSSTTVLDYASRLGELERTEEAIYAASGAYGKPYFRPPYGDYNAGVLQFLGDQGYGWTIMWSIDLLGWNGLTKQQVINRAMANHGNGYIYLMHVGSASPEGPALAAIIEGLQAKGYSFVRISQMTGGTSAPPPAPPPPSGGYAVGTQLKVTAGLYLRTGAGTGSSVITTMPTGTVVTVVSGPIVANGYSWYQLTTPYGQGWAAGQYLTPTGSTTPPPPPPPPPTSGGYAVGTQLKVTAGLYLRTGAGTGTGVITTMPTGTVVTVVSGPVAANGYTWYQVSTPYGQGWAAGQYLTPTGSTTPPPSTPPPTTGGHAPGTVLKVTAGLYLRSGAGTGTSVYTTMPTGTVVTVVAGPIVANGLTWYQVSTPYGQGWAAGEYMTPTGSSTPPPSTPPPTTGGHAPGTVLKVTAGLYLRSGAGTGTTVYTTMPTGTVVTIVSGPISANGLTWYEVDTPYGRGWAAGEYLKP